jgi:hypothetical protein
MVAGARPSSHARVKVGTKKDGTIVAWDSDSWGTVVEAAEARRPCHTFSIFGTNTDSFTAVATNIGPARAWRAPNHPQGLPDHDGSFGGHGGETEYESARFLSQEHQLTGPEIKPIVTN